MIVSKEMEMNRTIRSLMKNEVLFHENDRCVSVGILLEGEMKISSVSYYGDEILYKHMVKGTFFGNNLIFSEKPYYRGDIIALKDSKVLLLTKEQLLEKLGSDKDFLEAFLKEQSQEMRNLNSKIKILSLSDPMEKLMYYLSLNGGKAKIKSVTELARNLNLTRECTSRLIHRSIEEGIFIYEDHVLKTVKQKTQE